MALNGVLSRYFLSVGSSDAHGATELTSKHARDCDFVNPRSPCPVKCTSRRRRDRKLKWANVENRARTMPFQSLPCQTTRMKSHVLQNWRGTIILVLLLCMLTNSKQTVNDRFRLSSESAALCRNETVSIVFDVHS